jgi:hypothetical protein
MARSLKITYPGVFYPVTSCGNEWKGVCKSGRDRKIFPEYLNSSTQKYDVASQAYCLMTSHAHLLFVKPFPEIYLKPCGILTVHTQPVLMGGTHGPDTCFKGVLRRFPLNENLELFPEKK